MDTLTHIHPHTHKHAHTSTHNRTRLIQLATPALRPLFRFRGSPRSLRWDLEATDHSQRLVRPRKRSHTTHTRMCR
jgi:hypothetical protein